MQRTGKVVVSGSGRQIGLTCIAILLLSVFCFGQTPSSHPTSDDTPTTHVPTTCANSIGTTWSASTRMRIF